MRGGRGGDGGEEEGREKRGPIAEAKAPHI
jgi:hypothetical protein